MTRLKTCDLLQLFFILSGTFLRLVYLHLPGINGDEVYWSNQVNNIFSHQPFSLMTPSIRPVDGITSINALVTYVLYKATNYPSSFRIFYAFLGSIVPLGAYFLFKQLLRKEAQTILIFLLSFSPTLIISSRLAIEPSAIPLISIVSIWLAIMKRRKTLVLLSVFAIWYHLTFLFALPFLLCISLINLNFSLSVVFDNLANNVKRKKSVVLKSCYPFAIISTALFVFVYPLYPPLQKFVSALIHDLKRASHPNNLDETITNIIDYLLRFVDGQAMDGVYQIVSGRLVYTYLGVEPPFATKFFGFIILLLVIIALIKCAFDVIQPTKHSFNRVIVILSLLASLVFLVHVSGSVAFSAQTYRWSLWLLVPFYFSIALVVSTIISEYPPKSYLSKAFNLSMLIASIFFIVRLPLSNLIPRNGYFKANPVFTTSSDQDPKYALTQTLQNICLESGTSRFTPGSGNLKYKSVLLEDFFLTQPVRFYQSNLQNCFTASTLLHDHLANAELRRKRTEHLSSPSFLIKLLAKNHIIVTWSGTTLDQTLSNISAKYPVEVHYITASLSAPIISIYFLSASPTANSVSLVKS